MKKLMILAAVAAMAFGAKADWSCSLLTSFVVNANGDKNPGDSVIQSGYYQTFIIQNAGADITAVANYVKGKTVAEIASEAKVTFSSASDFSGNQYEYSWMYASKESKININPYQAYLVSFYGTPNENTPAEFCVVANDPGNAEDNELAFDDSSCATSGWQCYGSSPTPVPEPTSSLMMLIGLAGLALKRKVQG